MPVAEAQQRISSREFAEWAAFDRLDPIGPERSDLGFALVSWVLAQAFGQSDARLEAFIPDFAGERRREPQSAEEIEARMIQWFQASGRARRAEA